MKRDHWTQDIGIFFSLILNSIFYHLSGFFPRKKNRILFGAWGGNQFADNAKYLALQLLDDDEGLSSSMELIWIGKPQVGKDEDFPGEMEFVRKNSLKAMYYQLTADVVFITNSYRDLSPVNLLKGARVVQLWHGFGLKNTLSAKKRVSKMKEIYYTRGNTSFEQYNYFIASSDLHEKKILESFRDNGIQRGKVLKWGQPKNQFLLRGNEQRKRRISKEIRNTYGIRPEERVICYLPTFRDYGTPFSFLALNGEERKALETLLEKTGTVLLEKSHFAEEHRVKKRESERVKEVHKTEDSVKLLLSTDLLISDYSSCYVDYLLLDRPIIHYLYDHEEYLSRDRGLYYSIEEYRGGPLVREYPELLEEIGKVLNQGASLESNEQRERARAMLLSHEQGGTLDKLMGTLFPEETRKEVKGTE